VISAYYYLAVIRAMFMRSSSELQLAAPVRGGSPPPERLLQTAVFLCLAVSVASLFAVQPLLDAARHAANALPF
jgi:NADH:ubiquinone oxidoreductase subunit 2 (subunit N)